MKAWQIQEAGSLEQLKLQEISLNGLNKKAVRIKVEAIGVNPADLMQVMGTHQNPPPPPFSPGFEVAGTVEESASKKFRKGDRVLAPLEYGAYQELVDVPAGLVVSIPDTLSFTAATSIPVAYGTAYTALIHRAGLKKGEILVVLGAGGNVGSRMVALGATRGAMVIAVASGKERLEELTSLGANEVIDYKIENVSDRIKELTKGKGADVIADLVAGDMFQVAVDNIAWEGRILPIGAASGKVPQIASLEMLVRNASLVGTDFAAYTKEDPRVVRQAFKRLFKWNAKEKLDFQEPDHTFPFDEAKEVLQQMSDKKLRGKLVLTINNN